MKNFRRRGPGAPIEPEATERARGARPAGNGNAAARLRGAISGTAADRPPRNRPIYYVWAASPDHAHLSENKTAGRRLADFAKSRVWSRGRG